MKKVYVLISKIDGLIVDYTFNKDDVKQMLINNNYNHEEFHRNLTNSKFGYNEFTFEELVNFIKSWSTDINEE